MSTEAPRNGLVLQGVSIGLAGRTLVSIEASAAPGTILTVMGPSGVGKSTLLAFIGGFLPPDFTVSGRVILNGRDVTDAPPEQRGIGLLFQDPLLFPHLSVAGNLLLGLAEEVRGRAARRAAVALALGRSICRASGRGIRLCCRAARRRVWP
jgi:putative thiamine transport system ATP-binding protein